MKKQFSFFLLTVLLVTGISGCGKEAPSTETISTETTENTSVQETSPAETAIPDDLPEKDFQGGDMQILTTEWYTASKYIYAAEENGEIINDTLFAQRAEVSERFNVDIGLALGGQPLDVSNTVNQMVVSGDSSYDLVYNHDLTTMNNALKGDFYDLRAIEPIHFDKPWWKGTSEVFTIQGKLFCTGNALTLSGIYMNGILVVNKDLAADLQMEVPYEKVRSGNWYMDDLITMAETATVDLDGNGIMDTNDQWGLFTGAYAQMAMQSNLGGTVLQKTEDGFLRVIDDLSVVVALMEKSDKLMQYTVDDYGAAEHSGVELFVANKGLFMFAETRTLYESVRDSDITYGVLPLPKLDENQTDYRSAGFDIYWGVILPAAGNAELIGTCVDAMSCYNYNYVVPKVWETVLGAKMSESVDDTDMFRIIRDIQYVDLAYAFSGQNSQLNSLVYMINNTDSSKVVSFVESKLNSVSQTCENINETFREMHDH